MQEYYISDGNRRKYRNQLKPAVWLDNEPRDWGFAESGGSLFNFSIVRMVKIGETKISYIYREDRGYFPFLDLPEELTVWGEPTKVKKKDFKERPHVYKSKEEIEQECLIRYGFLFRDWLSSSLKKGQLTNVTPELKGALEELKYIYYDNPNILTPIQVVMEYLKKEYDWYPGCEYYLKRY